MERNQKHEVFPFASMAQLPQGATCVANIHIKIQKKNIHSVKAVDPPRAGDINIGVAIPVSGFG